MLHVALFIPNNNSNKQQAYECFLITLIILIT